MRYSLAGSDITATAIGATMLCLMKNEPSCKKLLQAIGGSIQVGAGMIPNVSEEVSSGAQAKQLPYLQAVFKEVRVPSRAMRQPTLSAARRV